jgi:hypothetical protein
MTFNAVTGAAEEVEHLTSVSQFLGKIFGWRKLPESRSQYSTPLELIDGKRVLLGSGTRSGKSYAVYEQLPTQYIRFAQAFAYPFASREGNKS